MASLRKGKVPVDQAYAPIYVDQWRERRRNNEADDPLPERTMMIEKLKAGDTIVVHSAGCFAITSADARQAMVRVIEKKASIYIVSDDMLLRSEPAVIDWFKAADAVTPEAKRAAAARAREGAKASGNAGAAVRRITAAQYKEMRPIWTQKGMTIDQKVALISATIAPISRRTLAWKFGRSTQDKKGKRK